MQEKKKAKFLSLRCARYATKLISTFNLYVYMNKVSTHELEKEYIYKKHE
jgi:hypothetical protein